MTYPTPTITTALDTAQPRRHGYSTPPSPSSPLSRPPLLADGSYDDHSPASSALMTPVSHAESGLISPPNLDYEHHVSDHSALSSLSSMPTPTLSSDHFATLPKASSAFPLLPAHHPLRNKVYGLNMPNLAPPTPTSWASSPPHTPKGHPLEPKMRFPKPRMHPISNPYSKAYTAISLPSVRIPRRLRPAILLGFCLFLFGVVYLNNAYHQQSQLDTFSHQQAAALGRRQAQLQEKRESNGRKHALLAQIAEAAVQSTWTPSAVSIEFANTHEELAALIAFVTSTTANALPDLDPAVPLDPAVVLDFDPTGPGARDDLDLLVSEVNNIYPLVLMGKMRDPWHREIKKMLAEYKITPAPLVIDVDQRRDHATFIPLVHRLLDTTELPQLLLQGKNLGSYHEVLDLKDKGEFAKLLEDGGMVVRDAKKKKKGVKERERIENERILGPAPIRDEE